MLYKIKKTLSFSDLDKIANNAKNESYDIHQKFAF